MSEWLAITSGNNVRAWPAAALCSKFRTPADRVLHVLPLPAMPVQLEITAAKISRGAQTLPRHADPIPKPKGQR